MKEAVTDWGSVRYSLCLDVCNVLLPSQSPLHSVLGYAELIGCGSGRKLPETICFAAFAGVMKASVQ